MPLSETLKNLFKSVKKEELTAEELVEIDNATKEMQMRSAPGVPAPQKPTENGNNEVLALVKTLSDEIKSIKESYAEQLKKTQDAEDELRKKAEAELTSKKTALLEEATKNGKIASKDEEMKSLLTKLMDADLEAAKQFVEKLPANPAINPTDKKPDASAGTSAPAGTLNQTEVYKNAENAFSNLIKGV